MYASEANTSLKSLRFPQITQPRTWTVLCFLLIVLGFCFSKYDDDKAAENQTLAIITAPKIHDVLFLDFRVLSDNLRPNEKYRLAQVVDITGDIVTLVYGSLYYRYHNVALNSIHYSQLSYKDYFEPKRYDLPLSTIKKMYDDQAIYLAMRPFQKKLFGNFVVPYKAKKPINHLTYGRKENIKGEAFLAVQFSETNFETAFDLFQQSANLGNVKGQVNLAEMYINGQYVDKNFEQALYWLKQASLQSYKPAILKYGIICKQTPSCNLVGFYQELTESGVNIKVRQLDFKLSS